MRTPVARMSIPCFLEMGKESIKLIKCVVHSGLLGKVTWALYALIFTQVLYIHSYMHKHMQTHTLYHPTVLCLCTHFSDYLANVYFINVAGSSMYNYIDCRVK